MDILKKYHCIRQHDITDCGAACLATISRQHGLKTPITKIRETAGTDKQGTNSYGVIKAAEKLGFTAKGDKKLYKPTQSDSCLRLFKLRNVR